MTRLTMLSLAVLASGCYYVDGSTLEGLGGFQVTVTAVRVATGSTFSDARPTSACVKKYAPAPVPPSVRGTQACPYEVPPGDVVIQTTIQAFDTEREPLAINKRVSFRVVPGTLAGADYATRTALLTRGVATRAEVRVSQLYGAVRVWVEDAPPEPVFENGVERNPPDEIPGARTYATGISDPIYFEEPTLASMQRPANNDNRGSPLVNNFVVIGRNPEGGDELKHNCPENDGPIDVKMVVTGVDNAGFFVTDLNACKQPEPVILDGDDNPQFVAEPPIALREGDPPASYLPGTYGSVYVYNYSYPEGLYRGDLLWTISGSVQEFTSTTQLTFAAWSIRDRVRVTQTDEANWDIHLRGITPAELSLRTCGMRTGRDIADTLCGYQVRNNNMKLESLESALVKLHNVRFPDTFANCDLDGNGEVSYFCPSNNAFADCGGAALTAETKCNIDCTQGAHAFAGKQCTEDSTFESFSQLVVEMAPPGPREARLDDSVPGRYDLVGVTTASTVAPTVFTAPKATAEPGVINPTAPAVAAIWCDTDVHYRFGNASAVATMADLALPANRVEYAYVPAGATRVAIIADRDVAGARCSVSQNPRSRINLTLKDAVPTLEVRCDPNDADAEKAQQCRNLRGATFDVVGHLRHVQPARPRWMVLPRDVDDLCCRPGPGLECPKPVKPCL